METTTTFGILETFDTNDRFIEAPAETSIVLEQNSFVTIDGETVSTLGNATFTQTTVTEGTLLTRTANNDFELRLSRVDNLKPGMRVHVLDHGLPARVDGDVNGDSSITVQLESRSGCSSSVRLTVTAIDLVTDTFTVSDQY